MPDSQQAEQPVSAPAGWFPDPSGRPQYLRYWDGQRWTEHYANFSSSAPAPQARQGDEGRGLVFLSLVMAVLMPFIGFLLGLVLLARKQDRDGLVVVMISIAAFVVWYALFVQSQ